jgi:type IV pilus assembly protein PilM
MKLQMPAFFSRKSAPLVGVDLSSSSVKVVELTQGAKGEVRLERYAIEFLERGAITDGSIEKPEIVAAALGRALKRSGSKAKEAALALPSASVITKKIMLPGGLRDNEYEIQVESEASQYIPFPIDEVNLDFQVLGPAANSPDEVDVLLAASRKEKVEDRVAIAEMVGLRAIVMDVEPYVVRTVLDHVSSYMPNQGQGQIIAVISIGQSVTSVTISLNGQTVFERDQMFGGGQLTQDIVRLYGLTYEEAEIKKRSAELPDSYQSDLLNPFIDQAAADIGRALQFFFTSTPYTRVDKIILAGGSSILPGLAEAVALKTQVSCEVVNPFQGMEFGESVRERQVRLDGPALLIASGLAMRRFDS